MLLCAEEITRTSDLKVAKCDLESRTKLSVFLDCRKTFFGDFREILVLLIGEVRIRTASRTSYPSSYLMELRKAESVCIFNDKSI